jgi:hypothetical protein
MRSPRLITQETGRSGSQVVHVTRQSSNGSFIACRPLHAGGSECRRREPHGFLKDLERTAALLIKGKLEQRRKRLPKPGLPLVE